jgi:hypothetical protein
MADDSDTSMTLTGIYSGLTMNMSGNCGTILISAASAAKVGYKLSRKQTGEGKGYDVVTMDSEPDVKDPPNLIINVYYDQQTEMNEVDLEVRYTDIPSGTSVEVDCSEQTYNIGKQAISGSSLISSIGKNIGPFNATIAMKLWITDPKAIKKTSALTLSMSEIGSGGSGPVKKTLLEKIQSNLSS